MKRVIVERLSPRHVGRLLHEADLKPHQSQDWLNPPDPQCAAKVNDICEVHLSAIERAGEGERTVPLDEITGIQALERQPCGPTQASWQTGTTRI